MKITKRQLRKIIKEEKAKVLKEAWPVGGEPSAAWVAFEKAVEEAAIPLLDAGMELDGVLGAMHDSLDEIFAEYEDEPAWDEADQDNWEREQQALYDDEEEEAAYRIRAARGNK